MTQDGSWLSWHTTGTTAMPKKPIIVLGKRYPSICAAIRDNNNAHRAVVCQRMKRGWSAEEAITTPLCSHEETMERVRESVSTPVKLSDGRTFPSIKAAAQAAGIPMATAYHRNKNGWLIDVPQKRGRSKADG